MPEARGWRSSGTRVLSQPPLTIIESGESIDYWTAKISMSLLKRGNDSTPEHKDNTMTATVQNPDLQTVSTHTASGELKKPWSFWNEAVSKFDMERLGADDTEPRAAFKSVLRKAAKGEPYPFAQSKYEEDDFFGWSFYSWESVTGDASMTDDEKKDLWVRKVSAFDRAVRAYHAQVSKACEIAQIIAEM